MKTTKLRILSSVLTLALGILHVGQATAQQSPQPNPALQAAIDGNHRSADNKARDVYRNPYETLTFFEIEPHHTVLETWPGTGWYSEILAPYLRDEGTLIAATYDRSDEPMLAFMRNSVTMYDRFLESNPELYGAVVVTEQLTESQSRMAEPGTVDRIVDFRNAHNWMAWNAENIVKAWHEALKPGGVVGLVDHRWPADQPIVAGNGYIHEQALIGLMEANGFRFAGRSEINANPRDTKDHQGGVWMLPPNLRGVPEEDQAHFLAIGESDRLTMKFVKE